MGGRRGGGVQYKHGVALLLFDLAGALRSEGASGTAFFLLQFILFNFWPLAGEFERVHGRGGMERASTCGALDTRPSKCSHEVLSSSFATLTARVSSFCRHRPPQTPSGASAGPVTLAIYGWVSGGSLPRVTAQVCSLWHVGCLPMGRGER